VSGAEHVHFASGRANKMRTVTASLSQAGSYRSDQRKVWTDIEAKFQESGEALSSTGAEADLSEARRPRFRPVLSAFAARDNQVGAAFGTGSKVIGIDLFSTKKLYAALSGKLLKSYLLDAMDTPVSAAPPSAEEVKTKMQRLFMSPSSRFPSPGEGETLRWTTPEGAGAALVADGQCIHAMAVCDA
jgi:hypothetical protein